MNASISHRSAVPESGVPESGVPESGIQPVERERLRRMRQSWQHGVPSDFEVQVARQRLEAVYASERGLRLRGVWMHVGLGALCGVLALAVVDVVTGLSGGPQEMAASDPVQQGARGRGLVLAPKSNSEVEQEFPAAASYTQLGGVRQSLNDGRRVQVTAEQTLLIVIGGKETEVTGPTIVEFFSAPEEVGGWRFELQPPPVEPGATPDRGADDDSPSEAAHISLPTNTGSEQVQAAWTRVAAALRDGDRNQAELELGRLAAGQDAHAADAARLARAQLWLVRGERERAVPELLALSRSGASPLIRQRAAEALAQKP